MALSMSSGASRSPATTRRRRELVVACIANAIEWYDFAVYGAMASVLAEVLLPPGPSASGLVTVFAVFASSFLARPVGAVLIGLHADRRGRRRALATMILLMTGATAAIGLLPPWSTVGVAAPIALLALRLTQGFSTGGQISTSIPFLLESAPRRRWGCYSGWHTATVATGIAFGIAVASLISAALSEQDLERWGWRIPFLIALPLGLVGLYVRMQLSETPAFEAAAAHGQPTALRDVWRNHGRAIRNGFVLVGVLAATFNTWFVFLPAHLVAEGHHRLPVALGCATAGLVAAGVAAPLLGLWSDQVGRRPLLLAGNLSVCLLAFPLYLSTTQGSWFALLLADVLVGVILGSLVISAHLAEQFPVTSRATGIALAYGLATALLGGNAPLVGSLLAQRDWSVGIPIVLAVLGAAGVVATSRAPVVASQCRAPAGDGVGYR